MRKKTVAIIVAVLMVWSQSMIAVAAVNPFSDLKSDHWAYDAIITLASFGLVEGYPDGTFGGDRTFTRYEMAMVFARILARFEKLLDEKVQESVEARAALLAQSIRETRQALEAMIEENYDDLLARINELSGRLDTVSDGVTARLGGLEDRVDGVAGQLDALSGLPGRVDELQARLDELSGQEVQVDLSGISNRIDDVQSQVDQLEQQLARLSEESRSPFTEEVQEALAQQASADLIARLNDLKEDLDDLARRVLRLEGSTPSRSEAQAIAERVVADALAELSGDVEAARRAAADEAGATARLIQSRVDEVADAISRLAEEFRPELERLGVRVAELEARMKAQEEALESFSHEVEANRMRIDRHEAVLAEHGQEIRNIWNRFDNVTLTGRNVTSFEVTSLTDGSGNALPDGVQRPQDPRDPDGDKFQNVDTFTNAFTLGLTATPADNVTVKAELKLVSQLFGEGTDTAIDPKLNLDVTTPGVLRSLHVGDLDKGQIASPFDKYTLDADKFGDRGGAAVNLVWGYDDSTEVNAFVSRVASKEHALGAALTYTLSEAFDLTLRGVRHTGVNDTVLTLESEGVLGNIVYHGIAGINRDDTTQGRLAVGEARTEVGPLLLGARVGAVGFNYKPQFGKDLKSWDGNYGPDWIERYTHPGEYDWVGNGDREVSGYLLTTILGLKAGAEAGWRQDEAGRNWFAQGSVNDIQLAGLWTDLLIDRRVNQVNETDATLLINSTTSILGADVRASFIHRDNEQDWAITRGEEEQKHTLVTAKADVQFILPLTVEGRFGVSRSTGASPYTYFGVGLNDYQVGAVTLNANLSTAANAVDVDHWWQNASWSGDNKDEFTIGVGYTIPQFFGVDLKTNYEYRVAFVNDVLDGSPRNTFGASFEKDLRGGEAKLSGEGKYVLGGTGAQKDQRDLTAKLNLTYPVFANGDLTLGGAYVESLGTQDPGDEYKAYHLKAGLEIAF